MALSTFAGGRLWGARYGAGRPWALALHGWGRDHHDFDPVLAGLDAIAVDLPGFGVAPEPPGPWSTAEYAAFLGPLLAEMAGAPVVVIGHSFGARVACRLVAITADAPGDRGRVGALVLTGAPLAPAPGRRPPRPSPAYRAARALHRAGLLSHARMEQARRRHGSEDYRRASDIMRGVLVKAVTETADGAYAPGLQGWARAGGALELVWGQDDDVASLAGAEAALAAAAVVPAAVTVLPESGHLITPPIAGELRAATLRRRADGPQ